MWHDRKQAWLDLYEGKRQTVVLMQFDQGVRPWPYPEFKEERIRYALSMYRDQCERTAWLSDDRIPYLCPYTGTEIFARAFGCRVHYPGDNMPFALPQVTSTSEAGHLKVPDPQTAFSDVWEIAEALRKAEPDGIMSLPDIQSPLDIAALIWEKTDFYIALLTEPEAVLELTEKIKELLTLFLDKWFAVYGRDFIAHYPDYYMPYGITVSEDEAGAISPALFERYCLPGLNELSDRYGAIGIHSCADSERQWSHLAGVRNLKVMNLIRPDEAVARAYDLFGPICAQMHSGEVMNEHFRITLPPAARNARLILSVPASGKEDALTKCEIVRAWPAGDVPLP